MTIGIYSIKNIINGKMYIGSSQNIEKRITQHYNNLRRNNHSNYHLQRAWNKYGEACFIDEILEECPLAVRITREQCWLEQSTNLYNIAKDATTPSHTSEVKKRIGDSHRGRPHGPMPEKIRQKISETEKGREFSEEHRKKLKAASKGRKYPPRSEDTKRRMSIAKRGHVVSEETRRKISNTLQGHPSTSLGQSRSEETKIRISKGLRGKEKTEEHKHKISLAIEAWWKQRREERCGDNLTE